MEQWTIQKLLNWVTGYLTEKGIDLPRLSAEMLLSSVLGMSRIELYAYFDKLADQGQLEQLHALVKRAGLHEPIQYLVGKTEFYSLEILLTTDCLIPRPETELLVERAIEFLRSRPSCRLILDLCTGSGAVAVAIAKNTLDLRIVATDISEKALSAAAKNVEKYDLHNRIELLCGDLFEPLEDRKEQFDMIVCNPPYISCAEFETLDKNVKDYEPAAALLAGTDGMDAYRKIIDKAADLLKPDSPLMFEVGCGQSESVKEMFEKTASFGEIKIVKDFNGIDRVVIAVKQKHS